MRNFQMSDIAVYIIAFCALGMAGLAVRNELFVRPMSAATPRVVSQWESIASAGETLGAPAAKVSVVEFSDFQCPFCARAERVLQALRQEYPSSLRIAYLHFPLTAIHPFAYPAAVASECAAAQNKFQPYHDSLFLHSQALNAVRWDSLAQRVGVRDIPAFRRCLDGDAVKARIEQNVVLGRDLSLVGTPAFIIDGELYPAGLTEDELVAKVRAVANH
jgi:protein-disulfide isomerase